MKRTIDVTPRTSIIESMRRQNLSWKVMIGELVDNAFDAGATRIEFLFDGKSLTISDDGRGCDDPTRMVILGDRKEYDPEGLGRYGIGAKDAFINAAERVMVVSTAKGTKRTLVADWREIQSSGVWEIDAPEEKSVAEHSGTKILLEPLRKRISSIPLLIEDLSKMYYPAIIGGRQIVFQENPRKPLVPVPLYKLPPMKSALTASLRIDAGRCAHVTAGLTPEGESTKQSGFMLTYGFRVIKPETFIGLPVTPGLFGIVELIDDQSMPKGHGWKLNKNKTQVIDIEDIDDALLELLGPLIAEAEGRSIDIAFRDLELKLNQLFQEELGSGKAKRASPINASGPIIPKDTGRQHRRAKNVQPGGDLRKIRLRSDESFAIRFDRFGVDEVAWKIANKTVILNRDHPSLQPGNEAVVTAMAICAMSSSLVLRDSSDDQRRMPLLTQLRKEHAQDRIAELAGHFMRKLNNGPSLKVAEEAP